jgi:HPt (histidine-containing phosphotransfer) domain-containing protein
MTVGPAEAHLDTTALDALRQVGGDGFLSELIDTFLADAPSLLAELRSSIEAGRSEEARRAAHTLKSNGATFGAQLFAELCRELEEMGATGRLERAPDLVGQVDAEYARVEAALAAVRDARPS